jgi:PAS domain S-box-containing protein
LPIAFGRQVKISWQLSGITARKLADGYAENALEATLLPEVWMHWPIERKVTWGLGIAVFALCGMGLIAYALILTFVNTSNWLIHTHLVIETIQGVRAGLDDAETSVRGYLLTQDEAYLAPYELVRGRIPGTVDRLRILTSDNPSQNQKTTELKGQVDRVMDLLQQAVAGVRARSASSAEQRKLLDEDQKIMSGIRTTLREIRLQENQLLLIRDQAWRHDLTMAITAAAILGLLNFVLIGSIYYVFTRDLTERRRAEAALTASEERLRLMIASIKDYAFFMLDPQGRVATWNDGAAIIKGYDAEEIIGQPFSTFFLDEDRKLGKPEAALDEAAKHGRAEMEGWRVRKDGSRFWTDAITSAIRDHRGLLLGYSEVARDLTERKLAEEEIHQSQSRLAAVLDGSPSVIFVKDPEGRYTLVNRRFEDSFQMQREQVLGKTDQEIFRIETAQKFSEHDAKALEAGKALEFEEVIPQKGAIHTYLSARVPLLGEDGQPYALCGVLTDITERKESEQEIQRLNRALQDRVIDRSVQLMQAADELKIERGQRQGAEERERAAHASLREVMRSSPVPMWTYDLETLALLEVNSAAVALHGITRDEVPHVRMSDLYPVEEIAELEREVNRRGTPSEDPRICRHRAKDGRMIAIGVLARRVDWEGRNAALVVVVSETESARLRDISTALEAAGS